MNVGERSSARRTHGWRRAVPWLLVIPYIGTLWVASYASITPEIWGIPFFYWYQFLWIAIGAAITIVVYLAEPRTEAPHLNEPRMESRRGDGGEP